MTPDKALIDATAVHIIVVVLRLNITTRQTHNGIRVSGSIIVKVAITTAVTPPAVIVVTTRRMDRLGINGGVGHHDGCQDSDGSKSEYRGKVHDRR